MRTSVIIPNYNYGHLISGCIESVLNQTVSADEIIVVDDGSTDVSRDVIGAFGSKIISIFQANQGQAAAISSGFSRATGEIILILDSDDFFMPNKIEVIKDLYAENDSAQWIFHDLLIVNDAMIPNLSNINLDKQKVSYVDERQSMKKGKINYDAPATSGLSFRRSFIENIFPLPLAQSIYISDHYIKFYCLAIASGIHLGQNLGGQLIHGENLYTAKKDMSTKGKIFANTAFALREKCPDMFIFSNSLLVEGRASANASGSTDSIAQVVKKYLSNSSIFELVLIELKTFIKTRRYKKVM
jgi:glycosyltransferase involved in cell wall biosynthesis